MRMRDMKELASPSKKLNSFAQQISNHSGPHKKALNPESSERSRATLAFYYVPHNDHLIKTSLKYWPIPTRVIKSSSRPLL